MRFDPEVAFGLLFIMAGFAVAFATGLAAWPGAAMLALIGLWSLWGALRAAYLRRRS